MERFIIFHAGSLAVPFTELSREFRLLYPEVRVELESAGSRTTARKISDLNKRADLVAVSDYSVIEDLLIPRFADWYITFAGNQMVIAYTPKSLFSDEINSKNWYEVLTREGVEVGRSDPNCDPCGYRTMFVWSLAEVFYGEPNLDHRLLSVSPKENVRPKETDLIALLEVGELDYIFQYKSVAYQHGLKFIELPPQINLSSVDHSTFYKTAKFKVSGKRPGDWIEKVGAPILYAFTIPQTAENKKAAIAFIKLLLSEKGKNIMENCGHTPLPPILRGRAPLAVRRILNEL
jgi:molybdate/tungstate transport system substrate-binding protein